MEMSMRHVIITLGHCGQVVRRQQTMDGRGRRETQTLSGQKRTADQRFGNNADDPLMPANKRMRGDLNTTKASRRGHGAQVQQNDLRLKLMRKELLNRIQEEAEARKKMNMDLGKKMSRIIRSSEERRLLRHAFPRKRGGKKKGPVRGTRDVGQRVTEHTPASSLPNASDVGDQPKTVAGLLHSLGLWKYYILFQAEEVDMAALKEMGNEDLKELGIPMGPRKKILALLPHSKRQTYYYY